MKNKKTILMLFLSLFIISLSGCELIEEEENNELTEIQEESTNLESTQLNTRSSSSYDFKEADGNDKSGLYWFKDDDDSYYVDGKPIIILVHGGLNYGARKNNTFYNFYEWNAGFFNWTKLKSPSNLFANDPSYVYSNFINGETGHAQILFNELKKLIEAKNFNNNEIRLVGHSWGTHVVSFAAKKLLKYINEKKLNILVSIDLTEPVVSWGYVTDDEGNTRTGAQHVKANLKYVAKHQRVKMKNNFKLFRIIGAKSYASGALGPAFLKEVLVDYDIKMNSNAYIENSSKTHEAPRNNYFSNKTKFNDGIKCSDTKILLENNKAVEGFEKGSEKIKLIDVEWTAYDGNVNSWGHGPIIYQEWAYLPHDCYKWVDVQKSYTAWRWEDVKHTCWQSGGWKKIKHKGWWGTYYTTEWRAKKNVIHCREKFSPHQKWRSYTKYYTVKEYWYLGTKENCGEVTHKKFCNKVWNFFNHNKRI